MDGRIAKLQELMKAEGAAKELLSCRTPEEAQAYLEAKGIEFSLDEVTQIGSAIEKIVSGDITSDKIESMMNGELSEEELEEVAGGYVPGIITAGLIILGTAVITGSVSAGVTALVVYRNEVANWFSRW